MPSAGRKSDITILLVLGVLTAAVMAWVFSSGATGQAPPGPPLRSVRSAGAEGTRGVQELLGRLGLPRRPWERPMSGEALADLDILYLIDPLIEPTPDEAWALRSWIHEGGVLVCSGLSLELADFLHLLEAGGSSAPRLGVGPAAETDVPPEAAELPLARDVKHLWFASPRTLYAGHGNSALEPLLADTEGTRIACRRLGDGHAVILADSSFLANRLIGREDNAIAAANLAAYARAVARGERTAVDEYHYGFGPRETSWRLLAGVLVGTPPGWAVLSVTLAGGLWLVLKGRRFGPRRVPVRSRRRSRLEFVHSVGATYGAAGAHRLAGKIIYAWFRGRCARRAALPDSTSVGELARCLARRAGGSAETYEATLTACERHLEGRLSASRLESLLADLRKMEAEALHGQ